MSQQTHPLLAVPSCSIALKDARCGLWRSDGRRRRSVRRTASGSRSSNKPSSPFTSAASLVPRPSDYDVTAASGSQERLTPSLPVGQQTVPSGRQTARSEREREACDERQQDLSMLAKGQRLFVMYKSDQKVLANLAARVAGWVEQTADC